MATARYWVNARVAAGALLGGGASQPVKGGVIDGAAKLLLKRSDVGADCIVLKVAFEFGGNPLLLLLRWWGCSSDVLDHEDLTTNTIFGIG